MFERLKLKLKKPLPKIEKTETSSEILKKDKQIMASGANCIAFSVKDFPIPAGICSEPVSEELKEYIKKDKLGQFLNNPITHCIFYNKSTGYCFFAGDCNKKQEISDSLVKEYYKSMKDEMEKKYENSI